MQVTLISVKDNFIDQFYPTNNYATNLSIRVGDDNNTSRKMRSLIQFDFSSIPSDAVISSAVLNLYRWDNAASLARTLRVFRAKRDWNESESTWNVYSTGNSWQTAGFAGANDREQSDIGNVSIDSTTLGWFAIQLNTSKVQEMLTGGVFTNNGFALINDTEVFDSSKFYSSDYTDDLEKRLNLVIDYQLAGPNPNAVGMKLKSVTPSLSFFRTSVRLRAQRRATFLRTKKKGN